MAPGGTDHAAPIMWRRQSWSAAALARPIENAADDKAERSSDCVPWALRGGGRNIER
jgi:hypothetical protein